MGDECSKCQLTYLGRVNDTCTHHIDVGSYKGVIAHILVSVDYSLYHSGRVYTGVLDYLCYGYSESRSDDLNA